MEQLQLTNILTELKLAYPYFFKEMSREEAIGMMKIYNEHFGNYDYEVLKKAIFNITSTEDYMPSIARIKKEIADLQSPQLPQAEDEWNKVLELVSKYGTYRELDALNEMKDYTRYIVKNIGFVNVCMADSEQQKWNRKEFIEEYNNLKDKQKELIQIGHKEVNVLKMLQEHNENKENE